MVIMDKSLVIVSYRILKQYGKPYIKKGGIDVIVRINGKPLNNRKAAEKPVKSESFTWQTKKAEASPVEVKCASDTNDGGTKTETLRDRLNRIREAAKRHILPLTAGINLFAVAPISTVASKYSVPVATQAAAPAVNSLSSTIILQPVISMLQELALPIGIGMSIWGLIEICIGNPGGKEKIKYAILSYVGVFIIPYFFYQIHDSLGAVPLAAATLKLLGA